MTEYLSQRGKRWVRNLPPLVKAHFDNFNNMYDRQKNPNGLINMGTAESHLVDQEMIALLRRVVNEMPLTGDDLHYNKFEGNIRFRTAIANHWQKVIFAGDEPQITGDNVAVCAGCTVALECLAMLLAEPGDVFLIPAPYYSSFVDDINERAGVIAAAVPCETSLSREAFEQVFEEQVRQGRRVRAILFSSPNNPTGTVYHREELLELISFAMEHDIDIISDEIYAQTVFDPEATFVSTLALTPRNYLHRVHVTSSFAKDLVLSGFRTGFCISFNPSIIQGFSSLVYYSSVSSYTQAVLTQVLQMPETAQLMQLSQERLKRAHQIIKENLTQIGVPVLRAQAGLFVFADFSARMAHRDFSCEHLLWERLYHGQMINISPGQLFGTDQPGWFRLCYAFDEDTVWEACRRLKVVL